MLSIQPNISLRIWHTPPPLWKHVCVHSNGQISARMSLKYWPDLDDPCDCLGGFNLSPSTRCSPLGPDTQGQTSSFTYPAPLKLTDPLGRTTLTSSHASSASWLRRCRTNTNHTDETTYFLLMASGLHKQHGNNQNKEQSLWMNKQRSVIRGRAPVFFLFFFKRPYRGDLFADIRRVQRFV